MSWWNTLTKLFGTSGIRGHVGDLITPHLAMNVGLAASKFLKKHARVAIGRDIRTSSEMLEFALISGLLAGGCDVERLGIVPTPALAFLTKELNCDAGFMITASHNPPEYNGIKVYDSDGTALFPEKEEILEKIILAKDFEYTTWQMIGNVRDSNDQFENYTDMLLRSVSIEKEFKIVVDPGCGAASFVVPHVLRELGCKLVTLNAQPDGYFPGRKSEPSPENLTVLCDVVQSSHADIGLAFDGDADRMVAVDENGNIAPDSLLALFSGYISNSHKGCTIVIPVDTSMCVQNRVEAFGGKIVYTKVGDVFVAKAIKKTNAKFGGEPAGAWIHPEYNMCPDGPLSAVRLLELIEKSDLTLSQNLDQIPKFFTKRSKISCPDNLKQKVMDMALDTIPSKFELISELFTLDGIRINFEDGAWILIRPSGTEPIIRASAEAQDHKRAKSLSKESEKIVTELVKEATK